MATRLNAKQRGARIKAAREAAHLTQGQLADKVGVSDRQVVGKWESGNREPAFDLLAVIANALDTTQAYLLGETDEMRRPSNGLTLSPGDLDRLVKAVEATEAAAKATEAAVELQRRTFIRAIKKSNGQVADAMRELAQEIRLLRRDLGDEGGQGRAAG